MKRLYGPWTSGHGGTYGVRRKGLLDEIPHARRIRGVVIVRTGDWGRMVRLLEEMEAEVPARTVVATRED